MNIYGSLNLYYLIYESFCNDLDNTSDKRIKGWTLSLKCENDWSALMLKKDKSNIDVYNILDSNKDLHIIKLFQGDNEIAKIEYITDFDSDGDKCALFSPLSQNAYDKLNLSNIKNRVDNEKYQVIGNYDISIESS